MGYVFSPFVMSRMNTRPQFIAALLISAGAQVSPGSWKSYRVCQMEIIPFCVSYLLSPLYQLGMGLSLTMPCPLLSLPCLVLGGQDNNHHLTTVDLIWFSVPYLVFRSFGSWGDRQNRDLQLDLITILLKRSHLWSWRRACSFCHHVCSVSTGPDSFHFPKNRLG